MQNDISASLSVLQNYYSRILKATQILISIGLVKKNDGAPTQWNTMQIRNKNGFYVRYYTNSKRKGKAKNNT